MAEFLWFMEDTVFPVLFGVAFVLSVVTLFPPVVRWLCG